MVFLWFCHWNELPWCRVYSHSVLTNPFQNNRRIEGTWLVTVAGNESLQFSGELPFCLSHQSLSTHQPVSSGSEWINRLLLHRCSSCGVTLSCLAFHWRPPALPCPFSPARHQLNTFLLSLHQTANKPILFIHSLALGTIPPSDVFQMSTLR